MDNEPKQKGHGFFTPVFIISSAFILLFVLITLLFPGTEDEPGLMEQAFDGIQGFIANKIGWFYSLTVNILLGVAIYLLFSRFAKHRLGGEHAKPEFSIGSWLAMLFCAGMGVGLMFWSVAEPVMHYDNPPTGFVYHLSQEHLGGSSGADFQAPPIEDLNQVQKVERAKLSMSISFFHWGFHAWGIYAMVGLALAFFAFSRGLPLNIRSLFYPIWGKKIYGPLGHTVDIFAVVSTLFGVATSLGLGAKQINAGLEYLFGIPNTLAVQIILIAVITLIATASLMLGLQKGIKRLSQLNIYIAGTLLLLALIIMPTIYLFDALVQNIGEYLQNLPALSVWTEAYSQTQWQNGWTIFYWAWWISWSPFVGLFIARISKGRTIREFMLGVLFVPVLVTFVWLTVFGNSALHVELFGDAGVVGAVAKDVDTALFVLLEHFPLAEITSVLAIVLIFVFFITSSDSASLVESSICTGGNPNPNKYQRIFWGVIEGFIAGILLFGGGLKALQTVSIVTGFPFAIILLIMCYSLLKGLKQMYGKNPKQIEKPMTEKPMTEKPMTEKPELE